VSEQVDPTTAPRGAPPEIGHEHANVTGGWLRPAVFGAMDGLVSNFALIAGVAGGSGERSTIVLAGLAGLAAGAFSMAAGEYTSVASQAEHARAEIEVERVELVRNPEAEAAELARRYVDRGLSPELAAEVARQLHRDPERALEAHTREELGVTLEDLPSARLAAVSSFLAFAVGAVIPAVVVSLLGLFAAGAVVTRITSRPWWYGGTRQLLLGAVAALLTYGFGTLVGAGLG
jgi:vacuolar iron transporter family protein